MWILANNILPLEQARETEESGCALGFTVLKRLIKNVFTWAQEGNFTGTDQGPKELLLGAGCCLCAFHNPIWEKTLASTLASLLSCRPTSPSTTWADLSLSVASVRAHTLMSEPSRQKKGLFFIVQKWRFHNLGWGLLNLSLISRRIWICYFFLKQFLL